MPSDAELHVAAHEVRILASILTRIATRDLEQRLSVSGITISSLQHGMLQLLRRHAYTGSELSRKMMITPATLVPAIDALERHGLIERGRDPVDRRRTPLLLTEHGMRLLDHVPFIAEDDTLAQSLAQMGEDKRDQLLHLLRELVGALLGNTAAVEDISGHIQRMVQEHEARHATTEPPE